MKRIDTATRSVDLFGAGKDGWKGGNPATNESATQLNASWFNAVQEEICNVIESTGVPLDANSRTQLRDAIVAMIVSGGGTGSLKRSYALDNGAIIREYGNVMTATVGYFSLGQTYNCAVNQATGVWVGRDIAGICWAEKNNAAGVKEYWFSAADSVGVVPSWSLVFSMDTATGVMTIPSTLLSATGNEVVTADYLLSVVPMLIPPPPPTNVVIDNTGATSDVSLALGDKAVIHVSAQTSIPLRVATLDNQQYIVNWFASVSPSESTSTILLFVNNFNIPSSVNNFYFVGRNNGMFYVGVTADGGISMSVPGAGGSKQASTTLTTSTANKHAVSTVDGRASGIAYCGQTESSSLDTSTPWTSLGTISFGQAVSGKITIERIG